MSKQGGPSDATTDDTPSGDDKPTEPIERTDRKVARAAGSQRHTLLVRALGALSELADQPPLRVLCGATIAAGLLTGRGRLVRTGLRMIASHSLATAGKSFIKHRIDRTRPFVMLKGEGYHSREGSSEDKAENSFPSGHTAGAVAVARAVVSEYPGAAPVAYTAAVAAGAIQVPRGTHYLSDVLVGAAIGLAADALVRALIPSGRA